MWRVRKDSTQFLGSVLIAALRGDGGGLAGFAEITRDITEERRADDALLIEFANVLVSKAGIGELLAAISAGLERIVAHDCIELSLYDAGRKILHAYTWDGPEAPLKRASSPVEDTPAGDAFSNRQPLLLENLDDSHRRALDRLPSGAKSAWWLPLINGRDPVGVLGLVSRSEGAFTRKELPMLARAAYQVAVAVANAPFYQRLLESTGKLTREDVCRRSELKEAHNLNEIVGESAAVCTVLKQVEMVGPTNATVLLLGETGTGKDLIARAIHALSPRKGAGFIRVNCAAVPGALIESELFGYERGAFTGAHARKLGRFDLAHQGTLFLDEVGDIPSDLQPKLLRVLQEGEFERVGGTGTILTDVRVVAATNRDLAQLVRDREFRMDLYYRLNVFPVVVPPLRDRGEDIPLLVRHFMQKYAARFHKPVATVPTASMARLVRWHWPGNVRELENFIERAVILSSGSELVLPALNGEVAAESSGSAAATLEAVEREHILRVLRETRGVIGGPSGAARRLAMKRTTLNARMRKLGISRDDL
jgi:transcriptional regulator with GAF, ATPase, and Fis domain